MSVSRRRFLRAGTMVGLSAVIPLNSVTRILAQQAGVEGLFKVPVESQADERWTEENFSRYVNTRFLIYTETVL